MSSKKSFIMYENWATLIANLPEGQAGQLIKAICSMETGKEYKIDDPVVYAMFSMIAPKLQEDAEAYQQTVNKRKEAAEKKWNRAKAMQKDAHAVQKDASAMHMHGDTDTDTDTDTDKDIKTVVDDYNATCRSLPRAKTMSQARRRMIRARLRKYSLDDIHKAFEMSEASDFLTGRSGKWGGANIDWILGEANIAKILDGNYANSTARASPANKGIEHDPRNDDMVKALFGGL